MSYSLCGSVVESVAYALAYAHPYASLRGAYATQALMHLAWFTIKKRSMELQVQSALWNAYLWGRKSNTSPNPLGITNQLRWGKTNPGCGAQTRAHIQAQPHTHTLSLPSGTHPLAYAQLTRSLREAYAAGGMHNSKAKPNGTLKQATKQVANTASEQTTKCLEL